MSKVIGIDLGTTNSAVAFMTEEGPRLIPNAVGETLTPSVVGLDEEGKLLVGQAAREYRATSPSRCASLFKRHMGNDKPDGTKFVQVADKNGIIVPADEAVKKLLGSEEFLMQH